MDDAVRIVVTPDTPTAVVAETTTWEAFPALWGELLGEVWTFLRGSGLTTGRNIMLYRDDLPRVEVGAEVGASFAATGRVVPSSLPGGRAAMSVVRGAPSAANLALAHAAVRTWCAAEGHALSGARWEIYGHWREDQDPAAFETEIYWLLEPGICESP
jgi:hypothetical protein